MGGRKWRERIEGGRVGEGREGGEGEGEDVEEEKPRSEGGTAPPLFSPPSLSLSHPPPSFLKKSFKRVKKRQTKYKSISE